VTFWRRRIAPVSPASGGPVAQPLVGEAAAARAGGERERAARRDRLRNGLQRQHRRAGGADRHAARGDAGRAEGVRDVDAVGAGVRGGNRLDDIRVGGGAGDEDAIEVPAIGVGATAGDVDRTNETAAGGQLGRAGDKAGRGRRAGGGGWHPGHDAGAGKGVTAGPGSPGGGRDAIANRGGIGRLARQDGHRDRARLPAPQYAGVHRGDRHGGIIGVDIGTPDCATGGAGDRELENGADLVAIADKIDGGPRSPWACRRSLRRPSPRR
jgi:hypothetical protein